MLLTVHIRVNDLSVVNLTDGLLFVVIVHGCWTWLQDIDMEPVRLDVYQTCLGSSRQACSTECQLLRDGRIDAIASSSTAEVCLLHA